MITIEIHDDGEHRHKTVKIFGITVYCRHDYTKNNNDSTQHRFQARLRAMIIGLKKIKRNDMKEEPNYIERTDEGVVLKADNFAILDLAQLLALQHKYTTLQSECKRFVDFVMNLTQGRNVTALKFEDEYLETAGSMLSEAFGRKTEY